MLIQNDVQRMPFDTNNIKNVKDSNLFHQEEHFMDWKEKRTIQSLSFQAIH